MRAPVTHILPLTVCRRARMLPVAGRVLARVGQQVSPTDVIAEADLHHQHALLDVRKSLGIDRSVPLERVLQRKVGDRVEVDDVIARTGGLFSKVLVSPVSGQIVSLIGSQILIDVDQPPFQLRAGMSGVVAEVIPDHGVVIEANGVLVQGVWGNNQVNMGMLLNLAENPEDVLTSDRLDVSMRGAVVMSGHCAQADALQAAAQLPLRGLILGSMTADLIPVAADLGFPVILTEGIGRMPMNSQAFRVLSTNEKRDAALNAAAWEPLSGERPEILIPLPASGQTAVETDEFKPGQTVRVLTPPHAAQVAVIITLLPGIIRLPSGLQAPAALIRLENDQQVAVPLANLDVLE